MKQMFRPLALAVCAVVAASNVAAASDSALKRLSLRSDALGWEAVGRLDIGNRGFCTGVLIAPDLVLTAGHCIYDTDGGYRDLDGLTFRAGLTDGAAIAESRVAQALAHPAYIADRTALERIGHDVALLRLSNAIPAATAAPFALGPMPDKGDALSLVSYARGRAEAQSWQKRCRAMEDDTNVIAVSCDATFGASGAPIFQKIGRRAQIVSLVSSGMTLNGKKYVLGMALAKPIADLKNALRNGRGVVDTQHAVARGARFLRP